MKWLIRAVAPLARPLAAAVLQLVVERLLDPRRDAPQPFAEQPELPLGKSGS